MDGRRRKKTGILNKDLCMLLDGLQKKLEVTWRWVEGHLRESELVSRLVLAAACAIYRVCPGTVF